ncbi:cytidine deaminase [Mesorhizobium loti]|nr:cytidine deaminase [Mesorhizobium loti]PLP58358.1 cytidine deaminase [Mesorhizobium loti]
MIACRFDELSKADQDLVTAAAEAREKAYTPYSNHKVGSAVRTKTGKMFAACNVEVVTLQQSVHAERNAVMMMAAAGERQIEAIVCHGPYSGVPCAECRQVIWEFCCDDPQVRIIGSTLDGEIELMTIGEIYPSPYGPGTKGIDPRKF